jgi:ribosomal protein S18 acetylase RimI-like enzyme
MGVTYRRFGTADPGKLGRMHLRERQGEDPETVAAIAARVRAADGYPRFLPDDDFVRFPTRPKPLVASVVENDGAIVGHVALNERSSPPVMQLARRQHPDGAITFVTRLMVDPGDRRHGHGGRLLDHARKVAIARELTPMLDVVAIPSAAAAIPLYRQAGWHEIGRMTFEVDDFKGWKSWCSPGPSSGQPA